MLLMLKFAQPLNGVHYLSLNFQEWVCGPLVCMYITHILFSPEVIGALVSVLIIWVITGVLFYEAIQRVVHRDFKVNADVMLITACVGVFVNVL